MSNYSGVEHIVINTFERAVSNDINNAAKAAARQNSNRLGRWLGTSYPENTIAGSNVHGYDVAPTLGATPLQADVYGGVRVRPFSNYLLIDPGTVGVWTSNGGADALDSSYALIDEPGVLTSTAMLFTANAGPGIRVDVVEGFLQSVVLEQESRDIFDPTTGLYTAALVPKRVQLQFSWRIRLGTQGAGYPGHAAQYMPIAVIITPFGSASFTDCAFYDVRPLMLDRIDGLKASYDGSISTRVLHGSNGVDEASGIMQGFYDVDGNGGFGSTAAPYRARGVIRSTVPGASDFSGIALHDATNWSSGVTFSGHRWGYVVALFPEGLPRWVKYSTNVTPDGERLPLNTMGILTVCLGPIAAGCSTNGAVINPPFSTGLTNAASGMLAAIFLYAAGGVYAHNIAPTFRANDGTIRLRDGSDNASLFINGVVTLANATVVHLDFDLGNLGQITGKVPFTTFAMRWSVTIGYTLTLAAEFRFTWRVSRGGVLIGTEADRYKVLATSAGNSTISDQVQFTLPNSYTAGGTPGTSGNVVVQLEIFEINLGADGFVANSSGLHFEALQHGVL